MHSIKLFLILSHNIIKKHFLRVAVKKLTATFSKTDRFTQLCDKCAHNSGQAVLQPLLSHLLQLNIIISQFFRTLVYFHHDHPTSRKNYPYRMFCPR